jgi:DmsE family decaheme c-type cytochrome
MSCKIRSALDVLLIPAADRKISRRTWCATESSKRPIALLVSGVIFGALLGFAQPARAETPDRLPAQLNGDVYSTLVDYVQSKDAAGPMLAAADLPNLPADVYHSALRGSAQPASATDDYSALRDFVQSKDAAGPVTVVADAKKAAVVKDVADYGLPAKGDPQVCLGCHGGSPHIVAFLKFSTMAKKGDPKTPMASGGCQSCHGPSGAHVASRLKGGLGEPAIVYNGPNASPVEARNEICLACHQGGMRMNWQGSAMQKADVACTSCHTVHAAEDAVRVKKTQAEVCFACHAQQRSESFQYSHHMIREGKVVCSDCHNPHGSPAPHSLKEYTVNETCYNCHPDKRGPMLWEHQPVREACTNCHTPHGSVEPRLMKETAGFLCSSCHSALSNSSGGAFGGGKTVPGHGGAAFTAELANQRMCLNCHSQVHGSNSPSGAYFLR